jgi:hypothetical protein
MKDDALFCVGQKAFIEKDGEILVLNDPLEGLDFPGGKIQVGETDFAEAVYFVYKQNGAVSGKQVALSRFFNGLPYIFHARINGRQLKERAI